MPLNFLGLGFLFGARDKGLTPTLDKVQSQLSNVNDAFETLQTTADAGLGTEKIAEATEALVGLQTAATEGARETSIVGALSKEVDGLQSKLKGGGLADALDVGPELQGNIFGDYVKGVRDAGDTTKKTAGETKKGATAFGDMANAVLWASGKASAGLGWIGMAVGPLISGFGAIGESIGEMLDRAAGIPARMGDNLNRIVDGAINLTNSLEGEATQYSQTARQIGTNLGYTGDRFRRFTGQATGMAMSLNIGAEEAGGALYGWDQAAEVLRQTGLRSARDLARFSAGLSVNAQELTNAQVAMSRLDMSAEQIGHLTQVFATAGREIADVGGTINELPAMVDILRRRFAAFGESGEQLQRFAEDTMVAAGALYQVTNNSEQARSMAQELAEQLTESGDQFLGLFAGMGQELPEFVTQLSSVSGDVDEAFRMMQGGPAGLIEGLQRLYESARENGADVGQVTNFMRQRLEGQLGSAQNAVFSLFRGMEEGSITGVEEMVARIRQGNVSLRELADQSFTTGRTMQENYERMIEMFQTSFRRLGRGAAQRFMTETRERLGQLREAMMSAGREAGPLGAVMRSMATADILGPLSLLPADMQGTAVAANQLRERMMPLINAFTSWGGLLDTVGNLVALFATDVMLAQERTHDWGRAIDEVATRYAGMFIEWLEDAERFLVQLADGFATFNWDNLFGREGDQSGIGGAFRRVLDRIGDMDWSRIWKGLKAGLTRLFERVSPWLEQKWEEVKDLVGRSVISWFNEIDWGQLWLDIQALGAALWGAIQPALGRLGSDIWDWLSANWTDLLVDFFLIMIAAAVATVVGLVVGLVALIIAPFIWSFASLYAWIVEGFEWIVGYFEGLGPQLVEIWQWVSAEVGDYFQGLGRDLEEIWQWVSSEFSDAWEATVGWFETLWDGVTSWLVGVWQWVSDTVGGYFESLGRDLEEIWQWVSTAFSDAWDSVVGWFEGLWNGVLAFYVGVWETILAIPGRVIGRVREIVAGLVSWFVRTFPQTAQAIVDVAEVWRGRFERVRTFVLDVWSSIAEGARSALDWIGRQLDRAGSLIADVWTSISEGASEIWQWVSNEFSDMWEGAVEWFGGLWAWVRDYIAGVWDRIKMYAQGALAWISRQVDRARMYIVGAWNGIRDGLVSAWATVSAWVDENVIQPLVSGFNWLVETVGPIWATIIETISNAVSYVRENYIDPFLSAMQSGWEAVRSGAEQAWQWISDVAETIGTGLVETPRLLRTAWEGIIGFFGNIFQRISETVRNALPSFTDLSSGATTALDTIMSTVIRLFGSSVHTVVGEDMEATQAVMTETAEAVSDALQTILYEATVSSIVEGFNEGFTRVSEDMEEFSGDLTDQFEALANNISEIMTNLFVTTVQQAETSMLALETSVESIVANLRTVTEAEQRLAEARGVSLATPDDEAAYQTRLRELEGNAALLAINNPLWWSAGGVGYRDLFDARMRELIDAVRESRGSAGAAPGGGGTGTPTDTSRLLREAITALQEAQRGAAPGRGGAGQPRVRRPGQR